MANVELNNIADNYMSAYENVKYGDGYLIGIHGVQTALNMQGYGKIQGVNLNSIIYGYHCVNTENMVKQFQKDNNLNVTEKIDKKTWDTIFAALAKKQGCIIIQTGDKEISIIDIDTYIEYLDGLAKQRVIPNSAPSIQDDRTYPESDSGTSYPASTSHPTNNDLLDDSQYGTRTYPNLDVNNPGFSDNTWYDAVTMSAAQKTANFNGYHVTDGGAMFDDLMYNYIVSGGKYYNGVSYQYNLGGGNQFDNEYMKLPYGDSDKDYDFIYNLLGNSMYGDGGYFIPTRESKSTTDTIKYYGGSFESSTNKPFFDPSNIDALRKSKFDITIVYGAKGEQARKIRQITPISVTQELNASGEPIYDVYEFIGRDVSYGL